MVVQKGGREGKRKEANEVVKDGRKKERKIVRK